MLARKKLKLFILVKHYIRLFKSFFRGFYNDFNLVWDSVNSSFYLRVKQSMFLSYTTNTYLKLALNFLKLNSLDQLQILVDLVANQFTLNKSPLYFIAYLLLSPRFNYRFKVILCLMGNPLSRFAPSVVSIFYNANWLEREAWDLFGIIFKGHPDLRGILTDYGFKGHPLQKDFPLVGLVDSFYSDSEKRVLYLPLELSQAPRIFLQKTIRP